MMDLVEDKSYIQISILFFDKKCLMFFFFFIKGNNGFL